MKLELPSDRNSHRCEHNWIPDDRPVIGLDFGTTNTVLSSYIHNFNSRGPQSVTFAQTGSELYPSYALYNQSKGNFLTGLTAYKRRMLEPKKVIRSVKRHLENEFLNVSGTKVRTSDVVEAICHDALMHFHDLNPHTIPQTIVATVPYHFLQNQNMIIRNAINMACVKLFGKSPELYIMAEPMAAALYWLYARNADFPKNEIRALVFDLGGGTFDLSYLRLSYVEDKIESEIVATTGDSKIGGDDIDELILNYIFDEYSLDLSMLSDKTRIRVLGDLLELAIEAKHELTYKQEVSIVYRFGDVEIDFVLQRDTFEHLLSESRMGKSSFMNGIEATVAKIADRQSIRQVGFDYIILVGGATKIPAIRNYVKRRFPKAIILTQENSYDHTSVALGASVYAAMLTDGVESPFGVKMTLSQFRSRTPYNYYIQKYDGKLDLIVKSGQICPVSVKRTYIPTHLKEGNELVDLTSIRIFQGPNEKTAVFIGSIDIDKDKIYAHGRKASDISIDIELKADGTILNASIYVDNGNTDKSSFKKEVTIQI